MIAKALGRSQGTISKEISHNCGSRGYRHKQADRFANARHQEKPKAVKMTDEIKLFIIELLEPIKPFVKSITFDNGKEFAKHKDRANSLECDRYFAKPYHSWERGQNENANGLLRQYFPKGISFVDIARKEVIDAVHKLNSRASKCLNYATPYEVFKELTGIDAIILLKGIPL
jgi:IS30 family transposase